MPRVVTVREVREEIFRGAGGAASAGCGQPSTILLGQWFHEVFAALVGPDPASSWRGALADVRSEPASWEAQLRRHAYDRLVGPRIGRLRAQLDARAEAFRSFWCAVESLCGWLAGVLRAAKRPELALEFLSEQQLEWRVRAPGWADDVLVRGVADALCRVVGSGSWCVIELKLGQGFPEADLAQACLYRQMLAAGSPAAAADAQALALLGFFPEARESLWTGEQVRPALPALTDLIGRLAGVLPTAATTPTPASSRPPAQPAAATPPPPAAAPAGRESAYVDLGRRLVRVFEEYGAPVRLVGSAVVGAAFLRFGIEPHKGVRAKRVAGLAEDVGVRLQLQAPPFIHTTRGQLVVDLQRPDRQSVPFSALRDRLPDADPIAGCSQVVLGIDLEGNLRLADLARDHSHILAAGTTGSGKSEWLRAAVAGLILTNGPETLRFVLIDPKRNAFAEMKGSPYLWQPDAIVYPDERDPTDVLDDLIEEMERRYRLLEAQHVDALADLARRTGQALARVVCVCDEYADLIGRGRKAREAIEERINRLGAKARAAGIHLIIATQQPSRETIKGALDTNMPCRVALRMTKPIESRMLLNEAGAERLLGRGDLLFKDLGATVRLQAPYLDPADRAEIFGGHR